VRLGQAAEAVAPTNVSANDIINHAVIGADAGRGGCTAGQFTRIRAAPCRSRRQRRAGDHGERHSVAARRSQRQRADPECSPMPRSPRRSRSPGAVPLAGAPRAAPAALPDTTVAVKRSDDRPSAVLPPKPASLVRVVDLRRSVIRHDAARAQNFLKTTLLGAQDFRNLSPTCETDRHDADTFSNDPNRGMASEKFDGSAVVFMSTATFSTASLR
jgi:hypothetical protein